MHYCSGEGGVYSQIIGVYTVSPDLAVLCCPKADLVPPKLNWSYLAFCVCYTGTQLFFLTFIFNWKIIASQRANSMEKTPMLGKIEDRRVVDRG